jgi:hypothetical protein
VSVEIAALFALQGSIPTIESGTSQLVRQTKDMAALADRYATGGAAGPYGWRERARETAEAVIGLGYGWLFEWQIGQALASILRWCSGYGAQERVPKVSCS